MQYILLHSSSIAQHFFYRIKLCNISPRKLPVDAEVCLRINTGTLQWRQQLALIIEHPCISYCNNKLMYIKNMLRDVNAHYGFLFCMIYRHMKCVKICFDTTTNS